MASLSVHSPPPTSLGAILLALPARPGLPERIRDGLIAVLIALFSQLSIAGIQVGLDQEKSDFPAPILAMAAVFLLFSISGCVFPGIDDLYRKRLKRATELLNRHMSIGFTIPVVMLCYGPLSDSRSIGMIIICFVLTGMFNTVFAYFLALPIQCLMVRYEKRLGTGGQSDPENGDGHKSRNTKHFCEGSPVGSTLTVGLDSSGESSESDEHGSQPGTALNPPPPTTPFRIHLRGWAAQNPVLILAWLLTITIGLPLRYTMRADIPLATFLLFSIWLTTLAVQTTIKSTQKPLAPWLRTLLVGLSNSVLWTALTMIAYAFIDSTISRRPLPAMLDTLQTHTPLSTLIVRVATGITSTPSSTANGANTATAMAAGDIAITLLNSGLVAWGLKLYEHRAHLLSRAGLTVCTVSAVLALVNLLCGPLFTHAALGVQPGSRAVAFAARSVTIALANPVMGMLRGDGGLNAAMVVGSGIVYQMGMGLGVGGWLEGRVAVVMGLVKGGWSGPSVRNGDTGGETGPGGDTGAEEEDEEEARTRAETETEGPETRIRTQTQTRTQTQADGDRHTGAGAAAFNPAREKANDPRIVAAGVTVGVNAAAMGTVYLYEVHSEAAPHAALSMIALGIMTVVFSSIPPLARWVTASVGA